MSVELNIVEKPEEPEEVAGPTLRVNEIFGPTIQGEGRSNGRHCLFLRLSRCNLTCSWCDTPYTWAHTEAKANKHNEGQMYSREEEEHEMNTDQIYNRIKELWPGKPSLLVISGGEPMLQQRQLDPLIERLADEWWTIEIETAGVLPPLRNWADDPAVSFNVSPKLEHSGNDLKTRRKPVALQGLAKRNAQFKFVVTHPEHFDEIVELQELAGIRDNQVWVMPEGITEEDVLKHGRQIADEAISRGWNVTLRTHTLLWGTKRGV